MKITLGRGKSKKSLSPVTLLYFSGHGYIKSTGGYLVTTDAKKYDEGISMDDILSLANQSKAKNKVIILDCCHSGAMGTPSLSGNSTAQLSEGMSVLTASRDSEYAVEVNGAGEKVIESNRGQPLTAYKRSCKLF